MKQAEVRESFFQFFRDKQHVIVPSAPVLPQGDPTLLFTNAGMNPFKDIFLGLKKTDTPRVADTQKCIRVSGKHNDLEEVGVDTYHHTFFEMLGNWSFGDYYKKESISWCWELLTKVWGLPKDKLYATVYTSDDEAADLWASETDIDPKHILRFGDKDNFWEMGETGPCGPCSEVHIDLGPEVDSDPKAWVNSESPRYREIWNLVFIQYNRQVDGSLKDLENKHVDTGMGFERICAILQGKESNYDSDVFTPIIDAIATLSGKKYEGEDNQIAMRVIADHLRAVSFSIADGVTPSNEGRGYVMRRLLRRAYRYGRNLGIREPFIHKLVDVLRVQMKTVFPEIDKQYSLVVKIIHSEEEMFHKTLDKGLERFNELKEKTIRANSKKISGQDAFTLYDTYGFPLDLSMLLARENGLEIDEAGFDKAMNEQKERSRKKEDHSLFELQELIKTIAEPTEYKGDDLSLGEGKIIAIIKDGEKVEGLSEGEQGMLIFDKSIFYGEGGGQVGDTGIVKNKAGEFTVERSTKLEGYIFHHGHVISGRLSKGESYVQSYDLSKRQQIRKNHSATHLLNTALHTVLGDHIKQSGSLVTPSKLRFDFSHFEALTTAQIEEVEQLVNEAILKNYTVQIKEMKKAEAENMGAMAFFEEKYGDIVRVVDMEGYSVEFCGGSHVRQTGEIGSFRILSESSSASGIRRIEAVSGLEAYRLNKDDSRLIRMLSTQLQVSDSSMLPEKLSHILGQMKGLQKEVHQLQSVKVSQDLEQLVGKPLGLTEFYYKQFKDLDSSVLREKIDHIKNENPKAVVFFAIEDGEKIIFLCGVGKESIKVVKAGDLVREAAKLCGGGGGGRPDFAQAGGRDKAKLADVESLLEGMITQG